MRVLHLISGGDSGGAKTHVLSLLRDLNDNIDADLVCYMEADFQKKRAKWAYRRGCSPAASAWG